MPAYQRLALMALLLLLPRSAGAVDAHPLHAATVMLRYENASRRLTGTLRAFTDDFTAAASGADSAAIARYVARRLRCLRPDGQPIAVRIGKPLPDGPATIVPLTIDDVPDLRGWRLDLQVLSERFTDQVNVARIRSATGERSLLFLPGDGPKAIAP